MYKRVIGSVLALMLHGLALAQVQSPEQFLGYKLGSRYTPHWRIVEYYKHLANAAPSQVKLQEYGKTNEGRPLMVAIVSSAENMGRLEAIRNNNLGLAMMVGQGSTKNAPVIVWLSYNVHGNETSSSEAGMATIWSLLDPANGQSRQWLQNSVVVIDPCMNPDGRDRYVNWFQSVAGTRYNPALEAREHREPWPGGRTNHYNFDLNRDWAWQTQVESQQRLKLYHQWMPQVHVDFHEQGVNQPYYFAPAAKPYHEIITPFQREFQVAIGRNHAKYFDQKGWLYFTREVFDLLYPSYGDTYPIFNGAIGMTYEQGGGPAGGAAALTDEGDTLTLLDRINHHHTTSLSTIELASQQSAALLDAFARYFSMAASTGFGDYRSYVIKQNANDGQRIAALLDLLQKNHISFSAGKEGSYRGLSYDSGKEESFRLETGDIVIPGAQAKGALVRVLFEPNTQVEDSNTYDITAWALPYAYGLKAYAVKQAIAPSSGSIKAFNPNGAAAAETYGYVIPWTGLNSVRLTGHLLQKGIKLRLSEQPFELGGRTFERGSIIILRTSNQYYPGLWNEVREVANQYQVAITPVNTGLVEKGYDFGSEKVRPLRQRRVAMLTGEGVNSNAAGEVWHFFDKEIAYPITLINLSDMQQGRWKEYDVLIMPNGNYRFLGDKGQAEALRTWVESGGHLVAMENAVAQLSRLDWAIKPKKQEGEESKEPYAALKRYEERERDFIPEMTPGSIYRVELDNTHPLGFGYPSYYYTLKQDANIYDFIRDGGWNVGVIKKDRQVAGFVGSRLRERLQDGLLFGVQEIGQGTITHLGDNLLFRSFWENGKLMFSNAVFLVGD